MAPPPIPKGRSPATPAIMLTNPAAQSALATRSTLELCSDLTVSISLVKEVIDSGERLLGKITVIRSPLKNHHADGKN